MKVIDYLARTEKWELDDMLDFEYAITGFKDRHAAEKKADAA
jgi:hypothetical protein